MKNLVALSATIIVGALAISATAAAQTPYLKQGASPDGLVLLSEHTGSIFFCSAANTNISISKPPYENITPTGTCAGIGGIPTTSLSGNGFVSMSFASPGPVIVNENYYAYGVAFVGNLATGYVVQCTYEYSLAMPGEAFGDCVPVANPAR